MNASWRKNGFTNIWTFFLIYMSLYLECVYELAKICFYMNVTFYVRMASQTICIKIACYINVPVYVRMDLQTTYMKISHQINTFILEGIYEHMRKLFAICHLHLCI